jgi:DNA damage-inducible protein 1
MIKIGDQHFPCSLTVLENLDIEFLLGLDMLRKHQCCIDLERNELRIGGVAVQFLPESEIPRSELEASSDMLRRSLGSSADVRGASSTTESDNANNDK